MQIRRVPKEEETFCNLVLIDFIQNSFKILKKVYILQRSVHEQVHVGMITSACV